LGNDKAKVLTLNLRNRLIFRAADEPDAVQAADFIGKKRIVNAPGDSALASATSTTPNRGTQNQTAQTRNLRDHRVRPCPLRTRLPPSYTTASRIGWKHCEVVLAMG